MSSRSKILDAVLANQPPLSEIGDPPVLKKMNNINAVEQFCLILDSVGGHTVVLEDIRQLHNNIKRDIENGEHVVSTLDECRYCVPDEQSRIEDLASIVKVYVRASLAVAENGAVWIDESDSVNRILPFICEQLKVVVNASSIVCDMHDAYERINLPETGYGAFIAGPSKTADIEQSLVIGAHGAKSCEVYILTNL